MYMLTIQNKFLLYFNDRENEAKDKFMEYNKVMALLAESITASSDRHSQFPFVRVPNFELLGRHTRIALNIASVIWAPFVSENQREQWANFTRNEQGWYNESLSIVTSKERITNSQLPNTFRDYIWQSDEAMNALPVTSAGPFAPLWHVSPPTASISAINYNILSETFINEVFPSFEWTRDFVMTASTLCSDVNQDWALVSQSEIRNQDGPIDGPCASHLTPVFGRLNDHENTSVGFLLSSIRWVQVLESLFHQHETEMLLVLGNSCNQSYSFSLQNGKVSQFTIIERGVSEQ